MSFRPSLSAGAAADALVLEGDDDDDNDDDAVTGGEDAGGRTVDAMLCSVRAMPGPTTITSAGSGTSHHATSPSIP